MKRTRLAFTASPVCAFTRGYPEYRVVIPRHPVHRRDLHLFPGHRGSAPISGRVGVWFVCEIESLKSL